MNLSLSQLKELSNEELRVRVAEACGIKVKGCLWGFRYWPLTGSEVVRFSGGHKTQEDAEGHASTLIAKGFETGGMIGSKMTADDLPNYPESLDCIAEAEKTLSDEEWDVYRVRVVELAFVSGRPTWRAMMQASARQRAIAFLAVRGSVLG